MGWGWGAFQNRTSGFYFKFSFSPYFTSVLGCWDARCWRYTTARHPQPSQYFFYKGWKSGSCGTPTSQSPQQRFHGADYILVWNTKFLLPELFQGQISSRGPSSGGVHQITEMGRQKADPGNVLRGSARMGGWGKLKEHAWEHLKTKLSLPVWSRPKFIREPESRGCFWPDGRGIVFPWALSDGGAVVRPCTREPR